MGQSIQSTRWTRRVQRTQTTPTAKRLSALPFSRTSRTHLSGTTTAFGTRTQRTTVPGIIGPNGKHNATKDAPDTAHAPQPDTNHANVQLATSTDYVTWSVHNASNDPLPEVGAWARQGVTDNAARLPKSNVWAPAITQRAKDKKYVLYYSALSSDALPANIYTVKGHHPPPHCVGAAISDSPLGPFNPVNASIACPLAKGGAIDPAVITDTDGTIYVAWKVDGNNIGKWPAFHVAIAPYANA